METSDEYRLKLTQDFRTILLETEHSGNTSKLYKFTYAEGNSGYSFGLPQFDAKTNKTAAPFLESIGFSKTEISALQSRGAIKSADLDKLNAKLAEHKAEIDTLTDEHLQLTINHVNKITEKLYKTNPAVFNDIKQNPSVALALMDYHNQYNLETNGKMAAFLNGAEVSLYKDFKVKIEGHLGIDDIQRFIDHTEYGATHQASTDRREASFAKGLEKIGQGINTAPSAANADYIASFGLATERLAGEVSYVKNTDGTFVVNGDNGSVSAWQDYSNADCASFLTYNLNDATMQWKTKLVVSGTTTPKLYMDGIGATAFSTSSYIDIANACSVIIQGKKNSIEVGSEAELQIEGEQNSIRAQEAATVYLEREGSAELSGNGFTLDMQSDTVASILNSPDHPPTTDIWTIISGDNSSLTVHEGVEGTGITVNGNDATVHSFANSDTDVWGDNASIFDNGEYSTVFLYGDNGYAHTTGDNSLIFIYNETSQGEGPDVIPVTLRAQHDDHLNNMFEAAQIIAKAKSIDTYHHEL